MRLRLGRAICALVGATLLPPLAVRPVVAQEGMRLNYVNADIRDVIRSLAAILGVNVLVTETLPATRVTYTTAAPVPFDQLGAVFEAILESQRLVLVPKGPVAEVMAADSAPATGPIGFGKEMAQPPLGLVTQIVPLEFISPDEAIAALTQLASPHARVDAVPRSNAILITDRGLNVARYLELLRRIDVKTDGEAGLRTYVVPLKHANAGELAVTLSQVFGVPAPMLTARPRVQALGDRALSRTLDTFRQRELESLEARRQATPPVAPAPVAADAAAQGEPGDRGGLVGRTTIVPDFATNSIVVRTAPPNFVVLRETIDALDVRPPQVLLEVMIAEVTLDNATQYGIDWSIFTSTAGPDELTGRFGPQQFTDSALAGVPDFLLRVINLTDVNARGVIRMLASTANVRVLSTPHVVALNNEEARILVGNQVPFSQSTRTGLDVVVDRVVQFRDVGTQLTIIPTINQDGYVTFRILQEVSALTTQTLAAALNAPIISTREAETSAIVKNGSTVVIGGLIDESREVVENGIPLLGYLFKNRSTRRIRTELAIFVTPYVIYTDEEAQAILEQTRARLKELPEEVRRPNDESPR